MCKSSDELELEYIETLTEKEKLGLEKARESLGDSFNIKKSIGFLEWINVKNK